MNKQINNLIRNYYNFRQFFYNKVILSIKLSEHIVQAHPKKSCKIRQGLAVITIHKILRTENIKLTRMCSRKPFGFFSTH